jgi:uracil-DNA glycosylase
MKIEKSWHAKLKEEIEKPYIKILKEFLEKEKTEGHAIYPPESLVFNAFSKTPYDKVQVVIIGQDPYHGPGQAHGLCFSVPEGVMAPPSLKNIFLELKADLGITVPNHGSLHRWAEQGVLLLNATLTVRAGAARSHYGKGWERFTDAVVEKLLEKQNPIVFMLWGRSAQEKLQQIEKKVRQNIIFSRPPIPPPFPPMRDFLGANISLKPTLSYKAVDALPSIGNVKSHRNFVKRNFFAVAVPIDAPSF